MSERERVIQLINCWMYSPMPALKGIMVILSGDPPAARVRAPPGLSAEEFLSRSGIYIDPPRLECDLASVTFLMS
jgi:hypothetical protein